MVVRLILTAAGMIFGWVTVNTMKSALEQPFQTAIESSMSSPQFNATARRASAFAELRERQELYDRVRALLDARDFAALNAMALEFRTTRARTQSGLWKLGQFHSGVGMALPGAYREQGCAFAAGPVLEEWRTATPSAPTPYIAAATMLLRRAWCFRGTGFAREVADDAWAPFYENINAAHDLLSAHKNVAAQDPEFYGLMEDIYVAQGREPSEFQALLDEGTEREPYYYSLYWRAYRYYRPRWHGSIEDVEAAARYAVERTREQDGLGAYARYYWNASDQDGTAWAEAIDWDTMKLAMRDVAERYPDPWNLANFARLGCMLNDAEVARFYFEALGTTDVKGAWDNAASWQKCLAFGAPSTARRSPERCPYAAIEAWPNEDFEKFCKGQ